MISGLRSERLLTLGDQVAMMRQDLDVLEARASQAVRTTGAKLARIEAPVAAGYNTFNVTFLDGTYTEATGNQTPTYDDRSTGVAHNVGDADMNVGDIITVYPWSTQWWFRRGATPSGQIPETGSFQWDTGTGNVTGSGNTCGWFVVATTGFQARRSAYNFFDGVGFTTASSAILSIASNTAPFPRFSYFPLQGIPPNGNYTMRGILAGLDTDDGQIPGGTDLDTAPRTTANQPFTYTGNWTDPTFTPQLPAGSPISYDVTAIVQEIFARPGWVSGNTITFFWDENGSDHGLSFPVYGTWQSHSPMTLTIVP